MSSATAYKVHVKLGPAEFEAEGPEETVKEQLNHFYIAATQPFIQHPQNAASGNNGGSTVAVPPADTATSAGPATDVDPKIIDRLFREEDGVVVLRAKPKGEDPNGEALLLILWGYFVCKNQIEITGSELVNSCKKSGIKLERVDETLDKRSIRGFVTTGGAGRRKSYSLTNGGMEHAASQARTIFA